MDTTTLVITLSIFTSLITTTALSLITSVVIDRRSKETSEAQQIENCVSYGNSWTTILSTSQNNFHQGINSNVLIKCDCRSCDASDIRLLDLAGNVIWEQEKAIQHSHWQSFWCGPNVYMLEVRLSTKINQTTGECIVKTKI